MGCVQSTSRQSSVNDKPENQIELTSIQKKCVIFETFRDSIKVGNDNDNEHKSEIKAQAALSENEEDLLCELLYQNFHPFSKDVSKEQQYANLEYLLKFFGVSKDKIQEKLLAATGQQGPETVINFKILEASGFESCKGKGVNCLVSIKNKPDSKIESPVLNDATSLSWNYSGSLPIDSVDTDMLSVEIWTRPIFAKATAAKKSDKNKSNITNKNGVNNFLKKTFLADSNSKCSGGADISLKDIPVKGRDEWVELNKKKRKVRLHLSLGSAKDVQVALKEHRQLVRVVVRHELQKATSPFAWDGAFSDAAEQILAQHRAYSSLSEVHAQLARWVGLCDHHEDSPFNFEVLEIALGKLFDLQRKEEKCFDSEDARLFWSAKITLLPNCLEFVRNFFKMSEFGGSALDVQLLSMLRILSHMLLIKAPSDKLTSPGKKSLNSGDLHSSEIKKLLKVAIKDGAREWVDTTLENVKNLYVKEKENDEKPLALFRSTSLDKQKIDGAPEEDAPAEGAVKLLIDCNNAIREIKDCSTTNSTFDEEFKRLDIYFSKEVTEVFDQKIHEVVKPIVVMVCKKLQTSKKGDNAEDLISRGSYKGIIELYCNLKSFCKLAEMYCCGQKMKCRDFHNWFGGGVQEQWLDIIFVKALNYIDGAIERDVADSGTKCSSSVVDVLEIFKMLENHVSNLHDDDDSASLASLRLVEKIAKCTEYYADRLVLKVALAKNKEEQICFSMNNIEKVRSMGLEPLLTKLTIQSAFSSMNKISTRVSQCQDILRALKRVVEAAQYTEHKIMDVGKSLSKKVMAKFIEDDFLSPFGFMNKTIAIFHFENLEKQLSEDNNKKIVSLLFNNLVKFYQQTIKTAKKENKPPIYFANLKQSLEDFESEFVVENKVSNPAEVEALKRSLDSLSIDPVHIFCLQRLNGTDAKVGNDSKGQIKLSVQLKENDLEVKILNASNLETCKSKEYCSPYVKILLHPKHNFASGNKAKTSIKRGAARESVEFEDEFDFAMEKHVENIGDSVVHLMVKDYKRFGRNQLIGETALSFDRVKRCFTIESDSSDSIPEIEMPLLKLVDSPSNKINLNLQHILPRIRIAHCAH